MKLYDVDDNWWWRIECGHHQNLFEEALDRVTEWIAPEAHEAIVAAAKARSVLHERQRIARMIETMVPDLHEEDEECVECDTIRSAARIVRGFNDDDE